MNAYKFYGLNSTQENIDRLKDILAAPYIWASSVSSFNDPFEFKVALEWPKDIEQTRERYFTDNPASNEEAFQKWFAGLTPNNKWYIAQETRRSLIEGIAVCCLTTEMDNHLLWSHYAKNHMGICLEFDITNATDIEDFKEWGLVEYSRKRPVCNAVKDNDTNILKKTCFNKSDNWKYENEFRIIFEKTGKKLLGEGSLKKVFIGCRADSDLRRFVADIQGQVGVEVFQMCEVPFEYKLEPRPIKKGTTYMSSFF